jgi:threonine dehydratase
MVGVEVKLYPSMFHALKGEPSRCGGSTLAEGIAVKNVTERTIALCRRYVDEVRLVEERDIERAVMAYLAQVKTLAEGAGAAGLAAVMADPDRFRGKRVGLVLCGGNIDPRILASVIYRELEREQRLANLRIQIDDRPGVLGKIAMVDTSRKSWRPSKNRGLSPASSTHRGDENPHPDGEVALTFGEPWPTLDV